MKCEQIREILETLAPAAMACDWDNPGFQVCRWEKEINSIYLAVDATDEVIAEAKELKADMILTHHPLIFGGIKNAKFRKQVVPGDVLKLETEIIKCKGPMGVGKAVATVNGKVAAEAEISFICSDAK